MFVRLSGAGVQRAFGDWRAKKEENRDAMDIRLVENKTAGGFIDTFGD